jgi:hypothetical protein
MLEAGGNIHKCAVENLASGDRGLIGAHDAWRRTGSRDSNIRCDSSMVQFCDRQFEDNLSIWTERR